MTIARARMFVESLTGTTPPADVLTRIVRRVYQLTADPDPAASNAVMAVAFIALVRAHFRGIHRDGAAALRAGQALADIAAAMQEADGDMP